MGNIEFDRSKSFATFYGTPVLYFNHGIFGKRKDKITKYIINENATILFWNDNTKTISKRHKDDKFDKELGFLFAYFYKKYEGSKASRKRIIDCIDYKKIKTFLFEFYVQDSEKTYEQARKFLANLKVE